MLLKKKGKCKKEKKKRSVKHLVGPLFSAVSGALLVSAALNKDAAAWKRIAEGLLAAKAFHHAGKSFFKKESEEE